eukprot:403373572
MSKHLHKHGLGCDPDKLLLVDFDSIKRERGKMFKQHNLDDEVEDEDTQSPHRYHKNKQYDISMQNKQNNGNNKGNNGNMNNIAGGNYANKNNINNNGKQNFRPLPGSQQNNKNRSSYSNPLSLNQSKNFGMKRQSKVQNQLESNNQSRVTDLSGVYNYSRKQLAEKSRSFLQSNNSTNGLGLGNMSGSRQTRALLGQLGGGGITGAGNISNLRMNHSQYTSPTSRQAQSDASLYKKLKEGGYNYEQTKQMLLSRSNRILSGGISNQKGMGYGKRKSSPGRLTNRDAGQISRMINSNSNYLSYPHGVPDHLKNKQLTTDPRTDRYKIYAQRSENPIVIPQLLTDIPALLSVRYGEISDIEIIFESDLFKYKPGIKHQYMSRWCQVTKSHFLYYAEGVPYASFLARPLAVIPLHAILSVRRVYVEVPEKDEKYAQLKNFQFEIFLKRNENSNQDGEDQRRWKKNGAPIINVQEFQDEQNQPYTSPLKADQIKQSATKNQIIEVDDESESPKGQNRKHKQNPNMINIQLLGNQRSGKRANSIDKNENHNNLLAIPGQENAHRASFQNSIDHDASMVSGDSPNRQRSRSHFTPSKKVLESGAEQTGQGKHLMPKPSPRKLSKAKDMSQSPDRISDPDQSQMYNRRQINNKILKEIEKHVQDPAHRQHLINIIQDSLSKPIEIEELIVRNPSSWIKSLSSNFTWTNRELEWYFAEDRFLFAAKDEEECDRWVCILNWLISANEDNQNQSTYHQDQQDYIVQNDYDQEDIDGQNDYQIDNERNSKEVFQQQQRVKGNGMNNRNYASENDGHGQQINQYGPEDDDNDGNVADVYGSDQD